MAWHQSHSLWIQQFAEGLAVLQFDPPGKSVRLTREVLDELSSALDAVEREPNFKALMIRSLKPGRFAQGPEVAGWKALSAAKDVALWSECGQAVWNRIQNLKIATIAWIQGACLGPGLELALACDQIIAVDHPSTLLGFAELDLGLIPSWGGYGALVRRIGLQNAFPLALGGRRLSARDAIALGLADLVATKDEPDFNQVLAHAKKRDPAAWTRRTWRQQLFERFARGRRLLYRGVERLQLRRIPDALPAPAIGLQILKEFVERGTAAGQTAAQSALANLAQSTAFANLVRLHELRERAQPTPGKLGVPVRAKTVGVLGATPLGIHLVTEIARRDGSVILRETDEAMLGLSILKMVQALNRDIQAGKLKPQDSQRLLSRIRSTITWKNFDEVDLVIDTRDRADSLSKDANELDPNVEGKKPIVIVTAHGRLVAAAADMRHPERLVGAAISGPNGSFSVVELRRTEKTNDAAVRQVRDWLGGLGLLPIAVGDVPGLLLARLWVPMWNEMVALVREGAKLDAVDQAMIRFGLGRGPFEYLDALGLDQAQKLVDIVADEVEPRVPIDPFWNEVLNRGWRGQASGKGFYRYARGRHRVNDLLVNWLREEGPLHGPPLPRLAKDEYRRFLQDRVALLAVNEAYRCLDEGRAASSDDLDLALMLTDWAPHRGGPIKYARDVGLPAIISRLREFTIYGSRYEPCPRLVEEAG